MHLEGIFAVVCGGDHDADHLLHGTRQFTFKYGDSEEIPYGAEQGRLTGHGAEHIRHDAETEHPLDLAEDGLHYGIGCRGGIGQGCAAI